MSLHTGIIPNEEIDVSELNLQSKKYVDDKLNLKVDEAGDTICGPLSLNDSKIWDLSSGTLDTNAVNKKYVDDQDNLKLAKSGGSLLGELSMDDNKITNLASPTDNSDASTKKYVDDNDALSVLKAGSTMSGELNMGSNKITSLNTPTDNNDAANKKYVDDKISVIPNGEHYMIFEFHSTRNNVWIQSKNLTGFLYLTNNRDIKLTILAHVIDDDFSLSNLNLYYWVKYWTKSKVEKDIKNTLRKTNVNEYPSVQGSSLQTFGIFENITLRDISAFTLYYKYFHTGNIWNESSLLCLVENI